MHITVNDLDFLIKLENRLGSFEDWSPDVERLWQLNEKLLRQREKENAKTAAIIAEKRKTDKTYCRSKKEKEKMKRKEGK